MICRSVQARSRRNAANLACTLAARTASSSSPVFGASGMSLVRTIGGGTNAAGRSRRGSAAGGRSLREVAICCARGGFQSGLARVVDRGGSAVFSLGWVARYFLTRHQVSLATWAVGTFPWASVMPSRLNLSTCFDQSSRGTGWPFENSSKCSTNHQNKGDLPAPRWMSCLSSSNSDCRIAIPQGCRWSARTTSAEIHAPVPPYDVSAPLHIRIGSASEAFRERFRRIRLPYTIAPVVRVTARCAVIARHPSRFAPPLAILASAR